MLEKFALAVTFERDGQKYVRNTLKNDDFEIIVEEFQNEHLKLVLAPFAPLRLISLSLTYSFRFEPESFVFLNGYQSWSKCYEMNASSADRGLSRLTRHGFLRKITACCGDYDFKNYTGDRGVFHGYTYAYVRQSQDDDDIILFGSLSEAEGFTRFNFDMPRGTVTVEKDLDGKCVFAPFTAMDIIRIDDGYSAAFKKYFAEMKLPKNPDCPKKLTGYTSWYNYYGKIDEKIALRDLESMSAAVGRLANVFQIDDGWQTAVGDWQSVNTEKFPDGMKFLADKIHEKGYMAGLWLAPFVAARNSSVVKEHPEWLVRDWRGKPILSAIAWGGAYTLDFYIPEAKNYIAECLKKVVYEWGYDLVKLDFLYAECMEPRAGKSRGQIMCEAMNFLRETLGNKFILGCGVPLGAAFGRVDMCRTGADIALSFEDNFIAKHSNKEVVSTVSSLINTIYRRGLSENAFLSDPDVMILRNSNQRFTEEQKLLISKINSMFGDVVFVSDDMSEYDATALDAVKKAMKRDKPLIKSVNMTSDGIEIVYFENGEAMKMRVDLENGTYNVLTLIGGSK